MPYDNIPDLGAVDPNMFGDPNSGFLPGDDYGADPNTWDPNIDPSGGDYGPNQAGASGGLMPKPGQTMSAGSILQKLFGGGKQPGQNGADLASLISGFGQGQKNDRMDRANLTQKYDQNMLAAQTGRNQTESDALKKLAQTSYLSSGGSKFTPPSLTLDGQTYAPKDLGFGPKPASAEQIAGANALKSQLVGRLSPGGTYTPQPLDSYAKPGTAEQIGNYGGVAAGGIGALMNLLGGGGGSNPNGAAGAQGAGGTGSGGGASNALGQGLGLAGAGLGLAKNLGAFGSSGASGAAGSAGGMGAGQIMGQFVGPAIGAATGIYGLSKNPGGASNVMNGAGTGASIGTMVLPGIGTAIGAGAGALYGGLQNLFTTTQKEKDGRTVEGNFEKSLGGFDGMMGAVGQGYASTGHSSQEAQTDVKTMLDAEKHGPQATQQALQVILSKMGKR